MSRHSHCNPDLYDIGANPRGEIPGYVGMESAAHACVGWADERCNRFASRVPDHDGQHRCLIHGTAALIASQTGGAS